MNNNNTTYTSTQISKMIDTSLTRVTEISKTLNLVPRFKGHTRIYYQDEVDQFIAYHQQQRKIDMEKIRKIIKTYQPISEPHTRIIANMSHNRFHNVLYYLTYADGLLYQTKDDLLAYLPEPKKRVKCTLMENE